MAVLNSSNDMAGKTLRLIGAGLGKILPRAGRGMAVLNSRPAGAIVAVVFAAVLMVSSASAERLKDISSISGIRDNQLVGYGLVMGLNGTGDKAGSMPQALGNMLRRMGLNVNDGDLKPKNVAAVVVTANMPTFARAGSRLDVIVSSISDAKSLQGGTLLLTPLAGPDGETYAVAQGAISIGGFAAGGVSKGHPTVGRVPDGAVIEREVPLSFADAAAVDIVLNTPDFTTVRSAIESINRLLGDVCAEADGPRSVHVKVPESYNGRVIELLALLESVDVKTDIPARVVINEKTGTIVLGERVTVSPVGLSHGNLTVEIKTSLSVSQPSPFSPKGETVVTPDTKVEVKEANASLVEIGGANLGEVVRALNSLGVTPRDLIAILQALKAAGALKAELEVL